MASVLQPWSAFAKASPHFAKRFARCSAHGAKQPRLFRNFSTSPAQSRSGSQSIYAFAVRNCRGHSNTLGQSGQWRRVSQTATATVEDVVSAKKAWPKHSDKAVGYWLIGSAVSVFGIVVFGGLTRLSESGLSITEWRPVTGSLPPFKQADWESEFTKYKSSPEFALLNSRMTLDEFKKIYWMEWTHRLWGRVIGMTFLVPTIYFVARKKVSQRMAVKLFGICGLIGFQGFIGWWMVASGLKEDLFAPGSHPRVSQYRLATHLGTAFVVYCSMLWSGLSILKFHKLAQDPSTGQALLKQLRDPRIRFFRGSVWALTTMVFITAMSGALVAGLDAGLIYNEFPWMGLGLTPPKAELWDPSYGRSPDGSDLWWRNMLENPSLVQLDHRILATTTFTAICALFAYPRLRTSVKKHIPRDAMKGLSGLFHVAWMQVTLGISTLIYMVPTWLAASHQAGALTLLTTAVILARRLHISPRQVAQLEKIWRMKGVAPQPPVSATGRTMLREASNGRHADAAKVLLKTA